MSHGLNVGGRVPPPPGRFIGGKVGNEPPCGGLNIGGRIIGGRGAIGNGRIGRGGGGGANPHHGLLSKSLSQ